MRIFVLALLMFCLSVGCRAATDDDPNFFYSVSFSNGMSVTRYAKPEYAESLRKDRSHCVVVNWSYEGEAPGVNGELKQEMDAASKAIASGMRVAPDSEVVITSLSAASALWVVYTGSGKEVATEINKRLHELTKSQFKVRLTKDPEWSVLAKYVKGLQEKQ